MNSLSQAEIILEAGWNELSIPGPAHHLICLRLAVYTRPEREHALAAVDVHNKTYRQNLL